MSARLLGVATEAVLRAGAVQLSLLGHDIGVSHKGEIDLVTEADRRSEDAILDLVRARCPGHDIVTEETALERTGSPWVWFVDPLDGTTNFAHGYPFFCSSVAVACEGRVEAGAVFDPVKQELFTASRGEGAFLNGRRLHVSSSAVLLRSLLVTGFPYDLRQDPAAALRLFNRIMGHVRAVRRDGAAALDLSYVAAGRADGFWEERLRPWDVMAGSLLVEEAGGRVSRFDGSPLGLRSDQVVASNGALHEALLAVLAEG